MGCERGSMFPQSESGGSSLAFSTASAEEASLSQFSISGALPSHTSPTDLMD